MFSPTGGIVAVGACPGSPGVRGPVTPPGRVIGREGLRIPRTPPRLAGRLVFPPTCAGRDSRDSIPCESAAIEGDDEVVEGDAGAAALGSPLSSANASA